VTSQSDAAIAHLFADHGTEAEALSTYGNVFRFTLDPRPNHFDNGAWSLDLTQTMPAGRFGLAVLHPPCTRWSDMPDVEADGHPDLIDRAREIGETIADEWIVENKPKAWNERPESPSVVLDGRMFGLPIKYERAFECSFPVQQPARQQRLAETETSPFFYSERSHSWWKSVKGLRGDYTKEHTAKNALPLAYVDYLCRAWLEATDEAQGCRGLLRLRREDGRAAGSRSERVAGGVRKLTDSDGDTERITIWRCTECGKTGGAPSGKSSHENFLGHEVEWYTPHHHDDE